MDGTILHGLELHAWDRLQFNLALLDSWHLNGFRHMKESLVFSRSDKRMGNHGMSRIDRIYVDSWFACKIGLIGIILGTTFSDHAPVILRLDPSKEKFSMHTKIPQYLLNKLNVMHEVTRIWSDNGMRLPQVSLFVEYTLNLVSQFLTNEANEERRMHKNKWSNVSHALKSTQILLECRPTDVALQQV